MIDGGWWHSMTFACLNAIVLLILFLLRSIVFTERRSLAVLLFGRRERFIVNECSVTIAGVFDILMKLVVHFTHVSIGFSEWWKRCFRTSDDCCCPFTGTTIYATATQQLVFIIRNGWNCVLLDRI
jgi:hypothetical protein